MDLTRIYFKIFLLLFLLYKEVSACSCVDGVFQKSRKESICDSYSYSSDVYVATVEAAYCKCLPNDTAITTFSCIQYSDDGNGVAGTAEATYECTRPGVYLLSALASCSEVTAGAIGSDDATVSPTIVSPVTNLSNLENCGLDVESYSIDEEEANCSILVGNPCIYTVRVGVVYKGNYATGTTLATLGPDVLTSCGEEGRVLTVGSQYLVGIGGACNRIGAWSEVSQFSSSELQILRNNMCNMLSTGAIVGIVIGATAVILVVAAVIGVIVLVCCKKTRHKAADGGVKHTGDQDDALII